MSLPKEHVHDEQLQSGSMCTCQDEMVLVYSILADRDVSLVSNRSLTLSFSCCYSSTFSCAVLRKYLFDTEGWTASFGVRGPCSPVSVDIFKQFSALFP